MLFCTGEGDGSLKIGAKDYRSMENIPSKKVRGAQKWKVLFFLGTAICIVVASLVIMNVTIPQKQQAPKTTQQTVLHPSPTASTKKATSDWKSIFDDEFNGNSLDTAKWMPCYHSGNCTNRGELEWYFPENVSVSKGVLTLTAEKNTVTAPDGNTYHYTSGMISSNNFSFTYGYIETRAKIAAGNGMWSAFWALPNDGSWPPEIDVQEILGRDPTTAFMSYHYNDKDTQSSSNWQGPDFSAGWHTFAVDWEPDAITWYIDGVVRKQYTNAATITNKPMYLLANLAVGGHWPGVPDATTVFPIKYEIDYIRVWQRQTQSISTSVSKIPEPAVGGSGDYAASLPVTLDRNWDVLTRTRPNLPSPYARAVRSGRSSSSSAAITSVW